VDVVEQPTWLSPPVTAETEPEPDSVAAAEVTPPAAEPSVVVPPAASRPEAPAVAAPQWPTGPRWPTAMPARQPLPPALPPALPAADPLTALMARHATEAMWAASSRDVIQPPVSAPTTAGVQPCVSCGISLSANARFCRRCGTSQIG
jgi:hypothetical protein